jgi:hypothetical protein
MKKHLTAILTSSALFAGVARAQVAATATTSSNPVFDNGYSLLDVRHFTFQDYKGDDLVDTDPELETRLYLGTKLFDKRLDLSYTFRFEKKPAEDRTHAESIKMIQPFVTAEFILIEGAYGRLSPYALIYPEFGSDEEKGWLGVIAYSPEAEVSLGSFGSLETSGYALPTAKYNHNKNDVKAEVRREDLGLVGKDTIKTKKRNLSYELETLAEAKFKVSRVKGLSIGPEVNYYVYYEPKYTNVQDSDSQTELERYVTESEVYTALAVTYKATDRLSLQNKLYVTHTGFYQDLNDKERYYNRLRLTYELL